MLETVYLTQHSVRRSYVLWRAGFPSGFYPLEKATPTERSSPGKASGAVVGMGLKERLLKREAFPLSGSSLEFGPLQIIDLVAKINSDSRVQLVEGQQGQHGPPNPDRTKVQKYTTGETVQLDETAWQNLTSSSACACVSELKPEERPDGM